MEENNYGISLKQIFMPVLKRWWIVLLAIIAAVALVIGYTYFFVEPKYSSSAKLGVKGMSFSDYQDSVYAQMIVNDCVQIITSDVTLDRAANALNSYDFPENGGVAYRTYSKEAILPMLSTTIIEESRYIVVSVVSADPKEAKLVCEFVAQAFDDAIKEAEVFKDSEGIMIDYPKLPSSPSSPDYTKNAIIGVVIGLVLSVGVILVIAIFKDVVDGEDRLIEDYKNKIPLLAVIPDANTRSGGYKKYSGKYGYGYGEYQNTDGQEG